METESSTQASVETTPTVEVASSTQESSTSTQATSPAPSATPTATAQSGGNAAETTPYTPSFKYKAMGKEYEFDEPIRGLIKQKEHEDKIRELYEKATGLDAIKQERESIRNDFQGYKKQWEPIINDVREAGKYFQRASQMYKEGNVPSAVNSMDNFFKHIGVGEKEIQQYVLHKLQMEDLPQEQKLAYNRNQELESQYLAMQERLNQYENQNVELARQQKTVELQSALSKPDVQSFAKAFDQKNGEGSFQTEVIRRGQWYEANAKKSPTADEVVSEMVKLYGFQMQASQPQQASTQTPKELPVIPVVKGGSSSPTSKAIQSLDDMKRVRMEKFGS